MDNEEVLRRRAAVKDARERVDRGEFLAFEEVEALLMPLEAAMQVAFSDPADVDGNVTWPRCCGRRCSTSGGFFGGRSECLTCGAIIVDGLAPLHSPLLPSGPSHVTVPGDALIALCERAGGSWLAMHEGRRDAAKGGE